MKKRAIGVDDAAPDLSPVSLLRAARGISFSHGAEGTVGPIKLGFQCPVERLAEHGMGARSRDGVAK